MSNKIINEKVKSMLYKKIEEKTNKMIEIRRYLHQYPEISFEEEETSKYITDFYNNKDVKVERNFGDGYGVVVTIDSGRPGKTIGLRADFDALAIQEETGLPYASKRDGISHACGHDGHTAYMLILAESLYELRRKLKGKIKIIHQPAEEIPPGGALGMIKAGVLDDVDFVLGVHGWTPLPLGTISCTEGPVMTGRSSFKIKILGTGGHGAAPNLANDVNVAASYLVAILQTIVSRRVDPFDMATLTIGNLDGSGLFNVINDSIFLEGDVRYMTEDASEIIEKEFKRIISGFEIMFDVKVELFYESNYPVLNNDRQLTRFVQHSLINSDIEGLIELDTITQNSASEDFAYFAQKIPAVYFFVGQMPDEGQYFPHHHPKFNLNEKSLPLTAKAVGAAALDVLLDYNEQN